MTTRFDLRILTDSGRFQTASLLCWGYSSFQMVENHYRNTANGQFGRFTVLAIYNVSASYFLD